MNSGSPLNNGREKVEGKESTEVIIYAMQFLKTGRRKVFILKKAVISFRPTAHCLGSDSHIQEDGSNI